jgi:hypothetical protein
MLLKRNRGPMACGSLSSQERDRRCKGVVCAGLRWLKIHNHGDSFRRRRAGCFVIHSIGRTEDYNAKATQAPSAKVQCASKILATVRHEKDARSAL